MNKQQFIDSWDQILEEGISPIHFENTYLTSIDPILLASHGIIVNNIDLCIRRYPNITSLNLDLLFSIYLKSEDALIAILNTVGYRNETLVIESPIAIESFFELIYRYWPITELIITDFQSHHQILVLIPTLKKLRLKSLNKNINLRNTFCKEINMEINSEVQIIFPILSVNINIKLNRLLDDSYVQYLIIHKPKNTIIKVSIPNLIKRYSVLSYHSGIYFRIINDRLLITDREMSYLDYILLLPSILC